MQIKWEKNSRVMDLVKQGKVDHKDVIPKTQTDNFPAEATTVRMQRITAQYPTVTLHIRGKSNKTLYAFGNGQAYECAETCRVNFGGCWQGKANKAMDSNGNLDENYTWLDVHNAVTEVKEAMGMK